MNIVDEYGHRYVIRDHQQHMKEVQTHRCCRRNNMNCNATVKTRGDFIIFHGNEHNHPPPDK